MPTLKNADRIRALEDRIAKLEAALHLSPGGLVLQAGESQVVIKKTSVEIRTRDFSVVASGKVNIKASGDVVIKGSKILQN